jgi:ribosomal protein S18 acetylase RimI-like enzyme
MVFQIRRMTHGDISAGEQFGQLEAWNQTRSDWERFLRASPEGCFVAEAGGQVVGTVATISYEGRFAWIGMVLVPPERRGRGIGTKLLKTAIDYVADCRIPCIKLDATPQGKRLYAKLDFVREFDIERWELQRIPESTSQAPPGTVTEELLEQDLEVFGADRSELLRSIALDNPCLVLQTRRQGDLAGYSLGRRGAIADHLGPWVARDGSSARGLLNEFLHRSNRATVFVDALKSNPWAIRLLRECGFRFSRPLTRMYRGRNEFSGNADLQCGVLGPEFG